jgi:NAD-dependent SIR2 family protein deacetylase
MTKIVIITGAGFSAPAKIPIQNGILKEMVRKPSGSFADGNYQKKSIKFLKSYINVGIYLLENFSNKPVQDFIKQQDQIEHYFNNLIIDKQILRDLMDINDTPLSNDNINSIYKIAFSNYYSNLVVLQDKIRELLEEISLDLNLEEIFTMFDKTIFLREINKKYSYKQIDILRQSLLKIFIYYFGLCTTQHTFINNDYHNVISFVNRNINNVSLISTNWDTLLENYFQKNNISYDLCLNGIYYKFDNPRKNSHQKNVKVKLIKVHGSINWYKCLSCGQIYIVEKELYGKFLFDDNEKEKCKICGVESNDNSPQLQPEIVTPTMIKHITNQLYNNLWRSAALELSSAEKIIFVGYSLPVADYELSYLLKRNITNSAKIEVVLYTDDDPKNVTLANKEMVRYLPKARYQTLFSQNKIDFFYKGFGDYFSKK